MIHAGSEVVDIVSIGIMVGLALALLSLNTPIILG
jgi:hypothetical protein